MSWLTIRDNLQKVDGLEKLSVAGQLLVEVTANYQEFILVLLENSFLDHVLEHAKDTLLLVFFDIRVAWDVAVYKVDSYPLHVAVRPAEVVFIGLYEDVLAEGLLGALQETSSPFMVRLESFVVLDVEIFGQLCLVEKHDVRLVFQSEDSTEEVLPPLVIKAADVLGVY